MEDDPALTVFTCPGVARLFPEHSDRITVLAENQKFTVADFAITAIGRKHHYSHPDRPPVDNTGFLFDNEVLYTGDALPLAEASTVIVTGDAPWLTIPDLLSYLRTIRPQQALIVHDGLLNNDGLTVLDDFLLQENNHSGREVRRLLPGEKLSLATSGL